VSEPIVSIIDDDEAVRASLDSLVRSLGMRSASFASAEGFLASEIAIQSRCVISDIDLPGGMTGFELAKRLVENFSQPLILISGRSNKDYEAKAREVGAICFLRKPFSAETLIGCLSSVLAF
jgi:FixJ family two-component response regulator